MAGGSGLPPPASRGCSGVSSSCTHPRPPASLALFQRFTSQLTRGSLGCLGGTQLLPRAPVGPQGSRQHRRGPRVTPAAVQAHPWRLPGALRSQLWKDRRALGCHCARVLLETRWAPPAPLPPPPPGSPAATGARAQSGAAAATAFRRSAAGFLPPGSFVSGPVCQERSPHPPFPWPHRRACSHSPEGGGAGSPGRPEWNRPLLEPGWLPPPPPCSPAGGCSGPWPLGTSHLPSSSQGAGAAMPIQTALWVALTGTNGQ